eukprot:TRINITY_DN8432_c0_g1_i1.p1 TRINITY_DN8432_c0_g1~~TRINITY_DN8432_c0_g1_i1.p1  ORF type:complete len:1537 (-),score=130.83 TRINITY_DN8432_c0_g1_i1:368-4978(-)
MTLQWSLLVIFFLPSLGSNNGDVYNTKGLGSVTAYWTPGEWGACVPFPSPGEPSCGYGSQTRNVSCVVFPSWPHKQTDPFNCRDAPKPSHERLCAVRCSDDCQVGSWQGWSICSSESCESAVRTRIRRVVIPPDNGGKSCPPKLQKSLCSNKKLCESRTSTNNPESISPFVLPLKDNRQGEATVYVGPWSNCTPVTSLPSQTRLLVRRDLTFVKSLPNSGPTFPSKSVTFPLTKVSFPSSKVPGPPWLTQSDIPDHSSISQPPLIGTRTREVLCRGGDGESIPFSKCMDGSRATVVPADRQSCVVDRDCAVGPWTEWSLLEPENCLMDRTRRRRDGAEERKREVVRFKVSSGKPCPHLKERRPSNQTVVCNFRYQWKSGSWGECQISSGTASEKECGGGIMTRNLTCFDVEVGRPAHPNLCFEKGEGNVENNLVKRCTIPCVQPCKLADWSAWSSCQAESCFLDQTSPVKGFQIRTRKMVNKGGDESTCSSQDEIRTCRIDSCYEWKIVEKGPCKLDETNSKCGVGKQNRLIECRKWDGKSANASVHCSGQPRPRQTVECNIPCPFDCIVSTWTEWTSCPAPICSSPHHHLRLPLKQRNRTVIADSGKGGQTCPPTDSLMEMGACPNMNGPCEWFSWKAKEWEECQLAPGYSCGKGLQTRKVYCQDNSGQIVPDWRCTKLETVVKRRNCEVLCPRNCEVSDWTEWSKCPDMCQKGSSEGGVLLMEIQRRERIVLVTPTSGGNMCPESFQVRPCPLLAGSCRQAKWHPGDWTNCTLPSGMTCGEGLRTRDLSCAKSGLLSLPMVDCLLTGQAIPRQTETCHVDCSDNNCKLSAWTAWSACPQACGSSRYRERKQIDDTKCQNKSLDSKQDEQCSCDKYSARPVGAWSECLPDKEEDTTVMQISPGEKETCGPGKRYRRMDCYDSSGNLVDGSLCGGSSYLKESCEVPCPVDCELSAWGDWGLCDTICGPGLKNRTSRVVRLPRGLGRPCPGPTVEYDGCNYPCENFLWSTGSWSQCNLLHGMCGVGKRKRDVRCVENIGDEPATVLEKFCDSRGKPESELECHEPCPGHCVAGEWSPWSKCEDCTWSSRRTRKRSILRAPDRSSLGCPPLEESRRCLANQTCWTYNWHLTGWTSCKPVGDSSCGPGIQTRGQQCFRSDGRPVPASFCVNIAIAGETEVSCNADCPVDCSLSPWSPWDESSCQCDLVLTNLTRHRFVVVSPSATGRPCPSKLSQNKPCPSDPCYKWNKTPWSECQLQGAACGTGVMKRNISCVIKPSNQDVDERFCNKNFSEDVESELMEKEVADLTTTASCYVSCHHDCTVSEWSQWSQCQHEKCTPQTSIGVRKRTRRIVQSARVPHGKCSPHLLETGSCLATACYQFQWMVRDGDVFCQRSDGLRVESGCKSRVVGCGPDCWSVAHASCQSGHCSCLPGYLPQFTPHPSPRLAMCVSATFNASLQGGDNKSQGGDIKIHYYPDVGILNYWMFAMISIGCIFIVFVGISIYILCQSTCRPEYRVPEYPERRTRTKTQEPPMPSLWT